MATPATDIVKLHYARQSAFNTYASPGREVIAAASFAATKSSGDVEFDGFSSDPPISAGDMVSIYGIETVTGWNGVYHVKSVDSTTNDSITCEIPAGKAELADITAGNETGDVTVSSLIPLRFNSEDLGGELGKAESQEITGVRGTADLYTDSVSAAGTMAFELSLPSHDMLVQAGLLNEYTYAGTTGVAVSSGDSVTFTASTSTIAETNIDDNLSVGDWIKVTGSTSNDGVYKVATIPGAGSITVSHGTLTDESTSSCTIHKGDSMTDSTTILAGTIERVYSGYEDGTYGVPRFLGMVPASLSLDWGAQGTVNGSISFVGSREYGTGTGESGTPTTGLIDSTPTGTPLAGTKPTGQVLVGTRDVAIWLDTSTGGCVKSASLTMDNNLSPKLCAGTLGATDMSARNFSASGSFTRYYDSTSQYDDFLAGTQRSLSIVITSPDGPALVLEFPRVEYSSGERGASGKNQDLDLSMSWTALTDSASTYNVRLWRWAA